jgi:hypothetical protein
MILPMTKRTRDVLGALGGIGYVGLSGAGWLLFERVGNDAEPWWSATRLAAYFHHHQTSIRVAAILFSLALGPYMVFLGRLRLVLSASPNSTSRVRSASSILWGSAIAGAVIPFLFMTFFWGMAYRPGTISPEITQACFDLCILTGPAGFAIWTAMLWSIGYIVLREGALPRWLGIGALIAGASQFLYIGDGFTDHGLFNGNSGLLGVYLCYGVYMGWILSVGIFWAVGSRAEAMATPQERTAPDVDYAVMPTTP